MIDVIVSIYTRAISEYVSEDFSQKTQLARSSSLKCFLIIQFENIRYSLASRVFCPSLTSANLLMRRVDQ